jgi:O-antigen ligase
MQAISRKFNPYHIGILAAILAELFFFLLLIKQDTLAVTYLIIICGMILLFFFPEFSISVAFTGNVLFHILYDYIGISISYFALIMGFVLQIVGALIYIERRCYKKEVYFGALFKLSSAIAVVLIIGVLYSSDKYYGMTKTILFLLMNMPLLVIVSLYRNDMRAIQRIFFFNVIIGLILAILSFEAARNALLFGNFRFRLSDNIGPLGVARPLCIAIVSAWFFVVGKRNVFVKLLFICALPFLVQPVIWSGSRGPLLAIFSGIMAIVLLQPRVKSWQKLILTLVVVGAGLYYFVHSSSQVSQRLATPLAEEASAAYRVIAYIQALGNFANHPLTGIGTGSFYLATNWVPLVYPHNLLLEVAAENGIVGLALVIAFLIVTAKYGLAAIKRFNEQKDFETMQLTIALCAAMTSSLVNAMVSGNIASNFYVWASAGLVWAVYISDRSNSEPLD